MGLEGGRERWQLGMQLQSHQCREGNWAPPRALGTTFGKQVLPVAMDGQGKQVSPVAMTGKGKAGSAWTWRGKDGRGGWASQTITVEGTQVPILPRDLENLEMVSVTLFPASHLIPTAHSLAAHTLPLML